MTEEVQNQNVIATMNKTMNQYNLLQIRLNTENILSQAERFLKAEIEQVAVNEKGQLKRAVISVGVPKANEKGIAAMLNWLQMAVNSQVVQGNFPVDKYGKSIMYDRYIEEFQKNFGDMLMVNLYNYGIEEDEYEGIIDGIMTLIIPFMTRLIGDKERSSYGETFKEVSTTQGIPSSGGIMKLFKS